ncbi:MAG: hypothetical protein OXU81_10905 [Gammaproteobacteria bacterium]|nr:hypothetical protein [Gammaproteobacteria bacterium]
MVPDRRGVCASTQVEVGAFTRTSPQAAHPDIQYHFFPFLLEGWRPSRSENGFCVCVGTLRERSRGTLRLACADPTAPPLIDFNYLDDATRVGLVQRKVDRPGERSFRVIVPSGRSVPVATEVPKSRAAGARMRTRWRTGFDGPCPHARSITKPRSAALSGTILVFDRAQYPECPPLGSGEAPPLVQVHRAQRSHQLTVLALSDCRGARCHQSTGSPIPVAGGIAEPLFHCRRSTSRTDPFLRCRTCHFGPHAVRIALARTGLLQPRRGPAPPFAVHV